MPSPYIVAEIGANHLGQLANAMALIAAAKEAGADAVKLQCWTPDMMAANPDEVIGSGPWAGRTLGGLYRECHTPWSWFPELFREGKRLNIDIFSSVFDLDALRFLEEQGCPRYKISSFEITDLELIAAVAKTGKPMVISTGMASAVEIYDAYTACSRGANLSHDVTLLHCVSAYPAASADMNLKTLARLGKNYVDQADIGLSDHSPGFLAPVVATALGATMIEKHLTLSRADGGPDASFSMEPAEFAQMVRYVREAAAALGEVRYGPKPGEDYVHLRRGPKGRGA